MNTKTLKSTKTTKSAAPRRAAKKGSDYNLHAAIIAVCVIAGLAVAACSANVGRPMTSPAPDATPIVETSPAPTPDATYIELHGKVQGVTTTNFDQDLNAIDSAMYSPETSGDNAVVAP